VEIAAEIGEKGAGLVGESLRGLKGQARIPHIAPRVGVSSGEECPYFTLNKESIDCPFTKTSVADHVGRSRVANVWRSCVRDPRHRADKLQEDTLASEVGV